MADTKISALPASTVPLAGTEVLPIVQSSTTKQVSVANLTAGRSFDALGMTLTSTDAAAAAAPTLDLYRNSASPAVSDTIGEIEFNGRDSAGNKQQYAVIHGSILSPTSTTEQGQIHFETATAGASTEKMIIGTTNLVINEIGAIFNVRIEGDTDANLFYTDATNSRVGVGTITPSTKLTVFDSSAPQVTFDNGTSTFIVGNSAGGGNNKLLYGTGAYPMIFYTDATEAMRIDSTQNLLVGATATGVANGGMQFQPAGNGAGIPFFGMGGNSSSNSNLTMGVYSTSLAQYQFYVGYAGTVFARSVVISALSDARLKENIVDLDVGIDAIMALKPRKFDWKEGQGTNTKNVRGFIAQELEQVFPDLIDEWRDPAPEGEDPYKSVRQDLMPVLVKAMQEQQALITALTARIEALENK
jgi:hypothetical protein